MLRRAQEIAQAANLNNIRFLQASVGDGQLAVGRADRALLVTVSGEIPNRQAALGELFAALKPGGILSVTEIIFDPHFQSRDTVVRLAGAVGFREKAFFGNRLAFTSILVSHFCLYLWTFQWKKCIFFGMSRGKNSEPQKSEILQGTLDLMVLKVLDSLGPQHGYGIARRIEQVSEQVLQLNEGTDIQVYHPNALE